jgi:hypothetical protein
VLVLVLVLVLSVAVLVIGPFLSNFATNIRQFSRKRSFQGVLPHQVFPR